MKRPLIAVLIVMLLASLACSININLPQIKTGPTQTLTINEPLSSQNAASQVDIQMGAGTLNLAQGADGLVNGTIKYNVTQWQPQVDRSTTGKVSINQGNVKGFEGIPTNQVVNDWQLKLNASVPLDLSINAGAYEAVLDLTGLHLHSLEIADGASKTSVTFSAPNPEKMDTFSYTTGASQVKLIGLANANFSSMSFSSGAGDYTLDFTGKLRQDTSVEINSGVSNMTIIIPNGMNVKVINQGAISNIDPQGTWSVNGSSYSISGEGYLLTLHVNMSLGNLKLVHQSN
jgi:hypothetical protein